MKEPMRLCVACRQIRNKQLLIRVVADAEGKVHVDDRQKMQGRGAYICKDDNCIKLAAKRHSFNRALRTEADEQLFNDLKDRI